MYIFVYGTLKRNYPNNYVLQNRDNGQSKFICVGRTVELFPLIMATKYDIPFLLDKCGIGNVILCNFVMFMYQLVNVTACSW